MDVCYRHPDRETGRRCANCDRPVSIECLNDVSLGGLVLVAALGVAG